MVIVTILNGVEPVVRGQSFKEANRPAGCSAIRRARPVVAGGVFWCRPPLLAEASASGGGKNTGYAALACLGRLLH